MSCLISEGEQTMNKIYRTIISGLLIVFLISGIYTIGSFLIMGSTSLLSNDGEKVILVMGTDKDGLRTDVLMLTFVNNKDKKIDIISIPRDTLVKIGANYHKINSAYAIGKEEQTIETVEKLVNVEIDGYVKFTVETFRDTIDALGGVNFTVPQDLFYEDPYQDLYIDLKEGRQHLNGREAEGLVRYRGYPTADIGRIAVQQEFIKELVKQKANPLTLLRAPMLIKAFEKNIDTSLNESEIINLALAAVRTGSGGITTYQLPRSTKTNQYSYYIHDAIETSALISQITGE